MQRWWGATVGASLVLIGPAAQADGEGDALRAFEAETRTVVARVQAGVVGVTPKRGGAVRVLTPLAGAVGAGVVTGEFADRHEILTTTDVIGPGVELASVVTPDGRELEATVIGRDASSGAVLLGCTESPGTPLPLGQTSTLRVGDRVCTAGSPFGSLHRVYQVAVSIGSLTGRYHATDHEPARGPSDRYSGDVLETDAGINPGSFGGPLCDAQGRVMGLVVSALSRVRWLGTAAPVDPMRAHLPALRAGLGCKPTQLAGVGETGVLLAPAVGETGVVVMAPAKSPLQLGDVILEQNGSPVGDAAALATVLARKTGAPTRLSIRRDGRTATITWNHTPASETSEDF